VIIYRSCVQFKCKWQAIIRGDSRLQNASIKSRNLKLSRSEDLTLIADYGEESVFPNLRIALEIILTMAVSIASCERFFSEQKLILSYLRAAMSQNRLCDLALMFKYVLSTMGVSKESISKFLIGNRFHVKLRILTPENCKQSLQVKSWKAEDYNQNFVIQAHKS